jgi:putative membrane protein
VLFRSLKQFQSGGNARSHVWFRFYNELPVVVLLIVLFLVVLKPF